MTLSTRLAGRGQTPNTGSPTEALRGLPDMAPDIAARLDDAMDEQAAAQTALDEVNRRLRRLRPPSIFRQEIEGQRREDFDDIDPLDRTLLIAELEGALVDATRRLRAARDEFEVVNVQATNALLLPTFSRWSTAASEHEAKRVAAERSVGALLRALFELKEAEKAERAAARETFTVATAGVPDRSREALRQVEKNRRVPVRVDTDGPSETLDRGEVGLFGDDDLTMTGIAVVLELAVVQPELCRRQLAGTRVGRAAGL
jgi:hypothetical protein